MAIFLLHIHHFLAWIAHRIPKKHHKWVKTLLIHATAVLVTIDCLRIIGVLHFLPFFVPAHVAEGCGGIGAVCGALTTYLD